MPEPDTKSAILARLEEYSCTYDAGCLPLISPFLTAEDPEIRAAAVNAVVVLGDPAGATLLRKVAAGLRNPRESAELLDHADYLELPSGSLIPHLKPQH